MTNIILCGGSGTRLWPISRTLMPKQFVKLFGGFSLFQETLRRNIELCDKTVIVSNNKQLFLALDQLEECGIEGVSYLIEPVGRNTAPAIALACFSIDPKEMVLVTPSDHIIKNTKAYQEAIDRASKLADKGFLVTFGITPTYPETGYGYIEADGDIVKSFKEKPDIKSAKEYLKAGNYYWNSGMFCFRAEVFLEELKRYSPKIYETSLVAYKNAKKEGMVHILQKDMEAIPEDSIDYAVMERSKKVAVVPVDLGWSDVGSFDALYEELERDENGNTKNRRHISINSKNNLIIGEEREIVTIDVEDMIVVDTGDALLLSKRGSAQKVKDVVDLLKKRDTELHNIHLKVYRPWGSYTVLEDRPGYKIKKIEVKPGKRLSLQKHLHRNEHWIVVSGTATVTVGEETFLVRPNESTYIKMGEIHRLSNEGIIPLVLIEAQVGEYTGEDDIIRLEDDYKRG